MQALKYLCRLGAKLLRVLLAPRLMKCNGPNHWVEAREHDWAKLRML